VVGTRRIRNHIDQEAADEPQRSTPELSQRFSFGLGKKILTDTPDFFTGAKGAPKTIGAELRRLWELPVVRRKRRTPGSTPKRERQRKLSLS